MTKQSEMQAGWKNFVDSSDGHLVRLYIGGDLTVAKQVIGKFCRDNGWCVTVTPTDYIYSGGQESGIIVECICYPRFETTFEQNANKMRKLADELVISLNQKSYTILGFERGCWSEYYQSKMPFQENTNNDQTK